MTIPTAHKPVSVHTKRYCQELGPGGGQTRIAGRATEITRQPPSTAFAATLATRITSSKARTAESLPCPLKPNAMRRPLSWRAWLAEQATHRSDIEDRANL